MTNYPSKLDTDAELPGIIDGVTENSAEIINSIREAVVAIETALGADPQGSATDLTTRIANALNTDGTIKSSALPSTLVDLPLTNSQIGASASIQESKLDLDFTTQVLQDQITSNDTDIASLQDTLAELLSRYLRHISGLGDRHESNHIDHSLTDGYSFGIGANVETALDYLSGQMDAHRTATVIREHHASAIEYDPGVTVPGEIDFTTSTNVQGAIDEVAVAILEQVRQHNDQSHNNCVTNDGYSILLGQGAVNDSSLKLARYQPNSGNDVIKVGMCNAPVVKTKGFRASAISSSAAEFDIQITIGSISRTISITGLHNSEYPVSNGRVTLLGVVDYLNAAFANTSTPAHFPVTAFDSEDGELVLQMNVARDDASITIKDPGGSTAITALGFTDIVDVPVGHIENYEFVIDGTRYTELETVADGYSIQASLSSIVELGMTVDSGGLDLQANSFIHVYNHDTGSSVGTYKVIGVPSSTSVQLSENLVSGGFSFIIYKDSMNTNAITSNRRVVDFYMDGREPVVSERATIVYGGVQGVRIITVSQNFEAFTGTFELADSGARKGLTVINGDGYSGTQVVFDPGFIGYLDVYSPDDDSFLTCFVFDTAPSNGTDTLTIIDTESTDNRLLLGSSHHNGLSVIEMPVDARNLGSVGTTSVGSEFKRDTIEQDISNLHLTGISRGYDLVGITSSEVRLRGGIAYISGRKVQRPSQTIEVTNVATSDGVWNLVLNRSGGVDLFKDGDSPVTTEYSVADILRHDEVALLSQITISGGNITGTVDARFFINDIESRLQLTVDDRDLGAGQFRSLEAAVLYSQNAPNDTKPEITILSDLTFSTAQSISSGSRIISFGDLVYDSSLALSNNSELVVYGSLTVTGAITVDSGAKIKILGGGAFSSTTTLGDSVLFEVDGYLTLPSLSLTNSDNTTVTGVNYSEMSTLQFTGTGMSLTNCTNSLVKELDLRIDGLNSVFTTTGVTDLTVEGCRFSQSTTLSVAQITQNARKGIHLNGIETNVQIRDCVFNNLSRGIDVENECYNLLVDDCKMISIDVGIYSDILEDFIIRGCTLSSVHTNGIYLGGSTLRGIVSYCNFSDNFDVTSTPIVLRSSGKKVTLSDNLFDNLTGVNMLLVSSVSKESVIHGNVIESCTTTGFAIDITGSFEKGVASDNIVTEHSGPCFRGIGNLSVVGNTLLSNAGGVGTRWDFTSCQVSNNLISNLETTDGDLEITDTIFTANKVIVATATIDAGTNQVSDNSFDFRNTSAVDSLVVGSTWYHTLLSGNYFGLRGSTNGVKIPAGNITVKGNVFVDAGGSFLQSLRVDPIASSEYVLIADNFIENGSNFGIYVNSDNVSLTGNSIHGATSSGDIVVATTRQNVLVSNNHANGTGGDSRRVFHNDSTQTNVFMHSNKGAVEYKTFSPYSGVIQDNWATELSGIANEVASGSTQRLMIPMYLDQGIELESINIQISNSSASGSATVTLYRRDTNTVAASAISTITSATNTAAGVFASLNVPVSSTEYVQRGYEYFTVVNIPSSLADGTIIVGQVRANIRI